MVRFCLGLIALLWIATASAQLNGYDEIFDESGKVRPHYQSIYQIWESLPEEKRDALFLKSKEAFSGDNYLEILPRILTAQEFEEKIKPGVEQRAWALRAFLQDHYSGEKRYLTDKVIPESVVRRALAKATEIGYDGKLNHESIAFIYGPDSVRDRDGNWRVIEDNQGFVGGFGDLKLAYDFLKEIYPQISNLNSPHPDDFYREVTSIFKERARQYGGKAVMYYIPHYSDNEDPRLKDILEKNGLEVVSPKSRIQLKVTNEGVFTYDVKKGFEKSKERVGFIFLNGEHEDIDPSYFEVKKKLLREEALSQLEEMDEDPENYENLRKRIEKVMFSRSKKGEIDFKKLQRLISESDIENDIAETLRAKKSTRGLIAAIVSGKVGSNYSPGVDFIGDKELYIYVPNFIKYYLKQEPILQNIATDSFVDPVTEKLNKEKFAAVFRDIKNKVIKPTDGRGGDGIFIGPYISPADVKRAEKAVKGSPENFIYQQALTLSHLRNLIVDIRVYAYVDAKGVWVGNNMMSRGLPMDRDRKGKLKGNGKVNLSDQGRELLVLIDRSSKKNICSGLF